ncbi:MAG: glycosyltransferase involved in cell wall biosynthesis [Marivirga sp.]|jgi:glycosyltransferase involved in cell wall biosynthesis
MRIAITLNTSWNIYNFRLSIIQQLLKRGHAVIAIAPKDDYTHKLTAIGCEFEDVKMDSRGANPIKDLGLTYELYTIYKKVAPDVILHYTIKPNIYGTLAAAKLGIPCINNISGLGTIFLNDTWISKVAMGLYRYSFRFPKKVYFQNQEDYQLFQDKNIIEKNICEVIPGSGIDLSYFEPLDYVEKSESQHFNFLMISRLIIDKGIREYVEAAKLLQERGLKAKFYLLGGLDEEHSRGILKEELDSWIEDGIIEYLGKTDDVRQFIKSADAVVLPSYREGTPRTLLEAAACNRPIVATNVPGCNNVVDDQLNGLLCKVKDAFDLSLKMKTMFYLGHERRSEMANAGRRLVERRFNHEIVIETYIKAIEEFDLLSPALKLSYVKKEASEECDIVSPDFKLSDIKKEA